jgi:hypothetical protein
MGLWFFLKCRLLSNTSPVKLVIVMSAKICVIAPLRFLYILSIEATSHGHGKLSVGIYCLLVARNLVRLASRSTFKLY